MKMELELIAKEENRLFLEVQSLIVKMLKKIKTEPE